MTVQMRLLVHLVTTLLDHLGPGMVQEFYSGFFAQPHIGAPLYSHARLNFSPFFITLAWSCLRVSQRRNVSRFLNILAPCQ